MRSTEIDVVEYRTPEYPVDPMFIQRWSPRAMSGESLSRSELMTLFEAARWAPSSSNAQHWRFLYAFRETEHWEKIFGLLTDRNKRWATNAAVLLVVVSRTTFERNDKPARTHSFDTGAAWMSLALQASRMGLIAHGMQGFDYERARSALGVPEVYDVEAMIAIGKPGSIEDLPDDLQQREQPSGRKPLAEIALEGGFSHQLLT